MANEIMLIPAVVRNVFEVTLVYCVGLLIFDYGCYYQSTIFTTLDGSGRGMDQSYRDPQYHPLPHWTLWAIAAVGLICFVYSFAFPSPSLDLSYGFAALVGCYFFARYILMRRGIS
jgi:hypothetical protein